MAACVAGAFWRKESFLFWFFWLKKDGGKKEREMTKGVKKKKRKNQSSHLPEPGGEHVAHDDLVDDFEALPTAAAAAV